MASAAAILFVRNDVDDIGWWISYHLALKFDALIVIDDHSTDGTWEVIQAAADLYPIEARRGSVPDGRKFSERRSEAFGQAIEASRSRFDWVICLESDEYVYPEHDDTIGAYLDRFADADAIMLHWSIFGSNGHIARTDEPPIAAYTRRAPLNFPDHALGKRFIRPKMVQDHTLDGCHYALDSDRQVTATGTAFDPAATASWDGARLLHYIARNKAHYETRLGGLPADVTAPDLWTHFDRNEEEDKVGQRFLRATRDHAARIARVGLDTLYWRIRKDIDEKSLSFLPESVFSVRAHQSFATPPEFECARLETPSGATLAYDPETRRFDLKASGDGSVADNAIFLITERRDGHVSEPAASSSSFLMLPGGDNCPSQITSTLTRWLPVQTRDDTDDNAPQPLLQLLTLAGSESLGALASGEIGFGAQSPLLLTRKPITPDSRMSDSLRPYLALRSRGNSLRDFILGLDLLRAPHADALACTITLLASDARETLKTRYKGLLPLWLAAA
ncbi:glycosyltransferase family 2 protein [Asaia astilbis]|uniref:glycosyltransferase family 2 protein n=1 Tax=Asaia astilbis TaxID=610244 RepID=UPI00046F7140|nr:glycosyltransferase family 2 protein [Asaia astilbis]